MTVPYEALYNKVDIILQSKLEEFHLYEYDAITMEQLWVYCVEKKWRKKVIEELPLYEIVSTIFSITPSELWNYTQVSNLKSFDGLVEINMEELEELLGTSKVK
ncbi:post-transcriptional regulator [Lysinibacillus odysseyi]|uniref:Post-transcriptional regulator n=1 Tax=Lysinibacillus odysseyi 34hs-1 = NBRC 100172 TaxID=1220589 RepID=A0A0A3IKT6_9BACI|nr:post-transcriptional regulator [Lysinibacillus odysseyi]KGR83438.1 hypothetical protein CD32_16550 [Lysinibacillus odysseyi 34hs-1 = NBRC 100172]